MDRSKIFQTLDFLMFFGFLALSLAVGMLFAYKDRKKLSTTNYYYGGKDVSPILVGISFAVSFVSSITVIGIPAEVYYYGLVYGWQLLSTIIAIAFVSKYYIPLYHKLQVTSVCQYLEFRFNRKVRITVSLTNVLTGLLYMSMTTFVSAVALATVTPLSLDWNVAITTLFCTLYTTLGGFLAVVWTDVLQAVVMAVGMIAILASTVNHVGNFDDVWEAAYRGGRINILKFGLDPRIRSTSTTLLIGLAVAYINTTSCYQHYVQRWLACKTTKRAQMATVLALVPMLLYFTIAYLIGLAAYAYYEGCDPLASEQIVKPDQLVPLLSLDVLRNTPGVAGLFLSAAFCAALSTISSGINALSVLMLEDIILIKYKNLSQKRRVLFGKFVSAVCGLMIWLITSLIALSPDNAAQLLSLIFAFGGPVLGIYSMGFFMPWIDNAGAIFGCMIGLAVDIWVSFSAMILTVDKSQWKRLPQLTNECSLVENFGMNTTTEIVMATPNYATVGFSNATEEHNKIGVLGSTIFAMSPFLYGLLGALVSIFAGHLISLCTGFRKPTKEGAKFSVSLIKKQLLPKRLRQYFEFHNEDIVGNNEGGILPHADKAMTDEL